MNAKERASLAEQLLSNPMFGELFDGVERNAIETMIAARDDATRARSAMRVQAIRDMRIYCQNSLRDTTPRRVVA